MTKKDLSVKMAERAGITEQLARKLLQLTFDCMIEALIKGEALEFRDFGVLKTKLRKARLGRNPRAGTVVQVPERRVATFKVGLALKNKINEFNFKGGLK